MNTDRAHALIRPGEGNPPASDYRCSVCGWHWQTRPRHADCPGVPRYTWQSRPTDLFTRTQLHGMGYRVSPEQPARGVVFGGLVGRCPLYRLSETARKYVPLEGEPT